MAKKKPHFTVEYDVINKNTHYIFDLDTDMDESEIEAWLINGGARGHNTPIALQEYARDKGFQCDVMNIRKTPLNS